MLSTKKPWAMLVFVLVAVNAVVALTALAGVPTPLDEIASEQTIIPIGGGELAPAEANGVPGAASAAVGAAILSLALWVIIAYGLSQGHTWAWWLLTFSAVIAVGTGILGFVTGEAIAIITLIVNVVLIAALLHKQTVAIFGPKLSIIKPDGLWGQA